MTSQELAKSISCGIFAERATLDEAFRDAYAMLKNDPAGMTALHMVLNTVAKEILKLNKETV